MKLVIHGKGTTLDEITVDERTAKALRSYLASFPSKRKSGPLFVSERSHSRRLGTRGIRKIMAGYFKAAGVQPGKSAHSLRHHMINAMIEGGVPITTVARKARHADPTYTLRYYYGAEPSLRATDDRVAQSLLDIELPFK